jgi:hypothetical protein
MPGQRRTAKRYVSLNLKRVTIFHDNKITFPPITLKTTWGVYVLNTDHENEMPEAPLSRGSHQKRKL